MSRIPRKRWRRLLVAAVWAVGVGAGVGAAWADTFELRDGQTIEGKIIAQMGDQYLIRTEEGRIRVDVYQIKRIRTAPMPRTVQIAPVLDEKSPSN